VLLSDCISTLQATRKRTDRQNIPRIEVERPCQFIRYVQQDDAIDHVHDLGAEGSAVLEWLISGTKSLKIL